MASQYQAGMRFGRLTLVAPSLDGGRKHPRWEMLCDCGTSKVIDLGAVTSGRQTACGCYRLERVAQVRRLELTGRRVGMLFVRRFYTSHDGETLWLCECDCGGGYIGRGTHLSRSRVTSCGCVARAFQASKKSPKQMGKYAANHRRRAKLRGAEGSFSREDVERIYRAQRGRCPWCQVSLADGFHRDHRTPLARGGSNTADNLELLCARCNTRKHAKDPIAWANENGRLL